MSREQLTSNITYYVRGDGSDANDGLEDTALGAFLTIQHAVDVAMTWDRNGYDITIQVRDGTFDECVSVKGPVVGIGKLSILGNSTTPNNVLIDAPSGAGAIVVDNCDLYVKYMKIQAVNGAPGDNYGAQAKNKAFLSLDKVSFGACLTAHVQASNYGRVSISGNGYTISGSAWNHYWCVNHGTIENNGGTITLSGTPAFYTAFINVTTLSSMTFWSTPTWSGSATGKRYDANKNSVLNTNGQATTWLPGNSAGSTATGGQYC